MHLHRQYKRRDNPDTMPTIIATKGPPIKPDIPIVNTRVFAIDASSFRW